MANRVVNTKSNACVFLKFHHIGQQLGYSVVIKPVIKDAKRRISTLRVGSPPFMAEEKGKIRI